MKRPAPKLDPGYPALAALVDEAVAGHIAGYDRSNPLGEAMYYAMAGGGKRLRGAMSLTAALQVGLPPQHLLGVALAVELIHCYTLVHDDMPCMDNSPMRRGRPSVHAMFNESVALLCGNALLCEGLLGLESLGENRWRVSRALLGGIGKNGVMLGQALDMQARDWTGASAAEILKVHELKTVKLFEATMQAAVAGLGIGSTHEDTLMEVARNLGFLLQWVDDLEDDLATLPRTEPSLKRALGEVELKQKIHHRAALTHGLIATLPAPTALGDLIRLLEAKTA